MSSARQLAIGAVLLLLGVFAWFLHVSAAADGRHSWQSGTPASPVDVRGGQTYHLSTRNGYADATAHAVQGVSVFACSYSGAAGSDLPLSVFGSAPDPRVLHRVASFLAPETGPITVTCSGLDGVYIDDARDAAFDRSGLYVLITIVLGFGGALFRHRRPDVQRVPGPVSGAAGRVRCFTRWAAPLIPVVNNGSIGETATSHRR